MADLIIPFLPPLGDDRRIPELEGPGRWEGHEVGVYLQRLAMAMDIEADATTRFADVVSVPDVWAHPLVFTAIWLDDNHASHEDVISEWRGLLALLGLSGHNRIEIDSSVIDLSDLSRDPWKAASSVADEDGGRAPNLMAILHRHMPRLVLTPNQSWNNLAIVHIAARPVGLVIPPTLVCPAREYNDAIPQWVYWRDPQTGRLMDPSKGDRITLGECKCLVHYLDHVIANVQECFRQGDRNELGLRVRGCLEEALKAYRRDVAELATRFGQAPLDGVFSLRRDKKPEQPGRLYPFLFDYPVLTSDEGRSFVASDSLLKIRPDIGGHLKGAVILDPSFAEQNALDPRSVRVWGEYFLAQVEGIPGLFETIRDTAARQGYAVLRTADLFTDTIWRIKQGEVTTQSGDASRYLLPLKPVSLLFATRDQLSENLKISTQADRVIVTWDLVVADQAGRERRFRATKTYSGSEHLREVERPMDLVLWPDFQAPRWRHHFVFYAVGAGQLIPAQPFSAHLAEQALARCGDPMSGVNQGLDPGFFAVTREAQVVQCSGARDCRIGLQWSEHAAEALFCVAGDRPQEEPEYLGVLLIGPLPSVKPEQGRWKVGIDFGTTNTAICCAKDEGSLSQPKPVRFASRARSPFNDYSGLVQDEFFASHEVESPFLSMLQEHDCTPVHLRRPLFSRRVCYVDDSVGSMLTRLFENRSDHSVQFDLKWSEQPEDLQRIEDYLVQIVLQTLAELVSTGADPEQVDWYFSDPGSFTAAHLEQLKSVYAKAVRQITGAATEEAAWTPPRIRQESEAAALYFIKRQQVDFSSKVITIDVSGNTSDIGIWNVRRLRWRSSLRLGGRHTWIPYLAKHAGLINLFPFAKHELEKISAVLQRLRGEPHKVQQALEILVNSGMFRKVFDDNLRDLRDEPEIRGLLLLAEFSLAGILYYLAKVSAYLEQPGHPSRTNDKLKVCLGGRGSLMFRQSVAANSVGSFERVFYRASGLNWSIDAFNFSDAPKHEVAFGLLIDPAGAGELDWSAPARDAILGEDLTVGGKTIRAEEVFREEHLTRDWKFDKLPEFERFVKVYERAFGRTVPFQRYQPKLISRVYNELQDMRHLLTKDSSARPIDAAEPVFVLVLREFINLMNENGEVISPRLLKFPGGFLGPAFNIPR